MSLLLSHIEADRSIEPLSLTVGDLLRRAADRAPDQTAFIEGARDRDSRRRFTYGQLVDEAEAGARGLLEIFKPGDHVAVLAPNMPEWTLLQLSAAVAGVVLVTVNPVLRPNEVRYIVEQSDSVGVVAASQYRDQDLYDIACELTNVVPLLRDVRRISAWQEIKELGTPHRVLPKVSTADPVMIQYTSGTTGLPKGAVLRHFGIVNSGNFIAQRLGRTENDVWLNPLPMFHTGGCVMGTLGAMASLGAQVVVSEFDPALVLRLIEEERTTYALGVPTMALALMEHPDFATRDHSSLQVFSSGATTVAPELVRRIEAEFGVTYNMAMGQTESSSVIYMTRLDSTREQKAETLGVPLVQWETKVIDGDGQIVPVGVQGEICCRGFGVMVGYYKMPEATAEAIDQDGWLHTGDLGSIDAEGYTRITGRIKDVIIRGGENIFPKEIEDVLVTHPAIADAAVIGVPHAKWGEQPVAFLRLTGDTLPSDEDLELFVGERLARHKVPREWMAIEALPVNAAGKVQKFILRDLYEQGRSG